jgi:hypothetical protein
MGELIEQEQQKPALVVRQEFGEANPAQLLLLAMQQGAGLDTLERFMTLKKEWEADEARKAFVVAKSGFRSECPVIDRTMQGHNNKYAGLADAMEQIKSLMGKYGLSHEWKTTQEGPSITVECVLTHIQGHSESTKLTAGPDASGNKNSIQAVGSTVSYLSRYTLFAILGLSSKEQDDDGNGTEATAGGVDIEVIRKAAQEEAMGWFVSYQESVRNHLNSIVAIKNSIATKQYSIACEAWDELDNDTKTMLWRAPSKGGIFTTEERRVMKSNEFHEAYYGPNSTKEQ